MPLKPLSCFALQTLDEPLIIERIPFSLVLVEVGPLGRFCSASRKLLGSWRGFDALASWGLDVTFWASMIISLLRDFSQDGELLFVKISEVQLHAAHRWGSSLRADAGTDQQKNEKLHSKILATGGL